MSIFRKIPVLKSIRSKLILSVACVHLVLMSVFVTDIFFQQEDFLMREKRNQAIYFAELISENVLSWVLAEDLMGMDEVIQASANILHTEYVCVVDSEGKVLAHTQKDKVGLFLNDDDSRALFESGRKGGRSHIWKRDLSFIHAASPIVIQGTYLGEVLVALSCSEVSTHLYELRRNGMIYICIAAIIGALAAWLLSRVIFHQLEYIMKGIRGLRKDDTFSPIPVFSDDELGHMAKVLNRTLSYLESSRSELKREVWEHTLAEKQIRQLTRYLVDGNEKERQRLGHDLHDELGQSVTGVLFKMHFLKTLLQDYPKPLAFCEQIIADIMGFSNEIRRVASGQFPVVLERMGLEAEVNSLLSETAKLHKEIEFTYRVELPKERLHSRLEVVCYRVLQESLSNVFKHSDASTVRVEITTMGQHLFMRIADDGKGFDAERKFDQAVKFSGMGLLGMKARVLAVKGSMEVSSHPGEGCVIDVILPLLFQENREVKNAEEM